MNSFKQKINKKQLISITNTLKMFLFLFAIILLSSEYLNFTLQVLVQKIVCLIYIALFVYATNKNTKNKNI